MKFIALWLYMISLFQLRLLDIILSPTINHDEESIFNMYGNEKTIAEISFQKSSVMFEAQCLAQCMHDYRCLSFEVIQLTADEFECSFFDILFQATNGLVTSKPGAKYYSKYIHQYYKDCASWYKAGARKNGVYDVWLLGKYRLQVCCKMTGAGGGWMTFQRRFDGSVNFNQTWDEYKHGFGNINGEHWLGNEWLHLITNSSEEYDLLVIVKSFQNLTRRKVFHGFKISPEEEKYKFDYGTVTSEYSKKILFEHLKGQPFTTKDHDNDELTTNNCAKKYGGGWWYRKCHRDLMNGKYPDEDYFPYAEGITWHAWKGYNTSLKTSELMIRPSSF